LASLAPGRTLLAFDFDGTLAPLVSHPDKAGLSAQTLKTLNLLARHYPIAVISGRGVRDLRRRLGFRPQFLVGNHGLEISGQKHRAVDAAKIVRRWMRQFDGSGFQRPAFIENKRYSLSLHYRGTPPATRRRMQRWMAKLDPQPRVIPGHYLFNLAPQNSPHKGDALRLLMKKTGSRRALFVGDDHTDEDVFRLHDHRILGVSVGRRKKSEAEYFVRGQVQVLQILKQLLAAAMSSQDESGS
jgi:trehalose 6-phosphate phosphatase